MDEETEGLRHPELLPLHCSVTQFRKLPPSSTAEFLCVYGECTWSHKENVFIDK